MKKKVIKLTENETYSFEVIGISSHENDYRVCWAINTELNYSLKKTDDHSIFDVKNNLKNNFSLFDYFDEESLMTFYLVSNRNENGYLIPELKNIDYFMLLMGETEPLFLNNFVARLKKINIVSTAAVIDINSLKSKKNFILNL